MTIPATSDTVSERNKNGGESDPLHNPKVPDRATARQGPGGLFHLALGPTTPYQRPRLKKPRSRRTRTTIRMIQRMFTGHPLSGLRM
jgi:hypothetical protein